MDPQRDALIGSLIGLARATEGNDHLVSDSTAAVTLEGLYIAFFGSADALPDIMERIDAEKRKLVPDCYRCAASCGRNNAYDMTRLQKADGKIRALKNSILSELREISESACSSADLGPRKESVHKLLYKALYAIGMDDWEEAELLPIAREAVSVSLMCKSLLHPAGSSRIDE